MDIEGYVLGVGRPMLIAEAIYIFSVMLRSERVIAIRDRSLVRLVTSCRIHDLI
jgi:hypothetical protein